MNQYRNTDKDIHKRIFCFVVNCFKDVVKKIPKTIENIPIIQQLSSALTSMGANDNEADATLLTKDFIAKFSIVKKETNETYYWLSFIKEENLISNNNIDFYIKECKEIFLVVSKIINNTRNKTT